MNIYAVFIHVSVFQYAPSGFSYYCVFFPSKQHDSVVYPELFRHFRRLMHYDFLVSGGL